MTDLIAVLIIALVIIFFLKLGKFSIKVIAFCAIGYLIVKVLPTLL